MIVFASGAGWESRPGAVSVQFQTLTERKGESRVCTLWNRSGERADVLTHIVPIHGTILTCWTRSTDVTERRMYIMVYHVAKTGSDLFQGSERTPFLTINKAASLARPGDTVIVHEGVYREHVDPQRGGLSDQRRITYEAAHGEHVVIKGSEVIHQWVLERGTVWKTTLPNTYFGDFNPYIETSTWRLGCQHRKDGTPG